MSAKEGQLTAAVLLAALAIQMSDALQPFEFRGLTTATTEQEAVQRGLVGRCKKYPFPGVRECGLANTTIGGFGTLFATAQFQNGRFVYVGALVAQKNFDQLKATLDQRYGQPCLSDPSLSRSLVVGRSFYWCFADGAAKIEQFSTGGMTKFAFYARTYDDIIADLQPKVDF